MLQLEFLSYFYEDMPILIPLKFILIKNEVRRKDGKCRDDNEAGYFGFSSRP